MLETEEASHRVSIDFTEMQRDAQLTISSDVGTPKSLLFSNSSQGHLTLRGFVVNGSYFYEDIHQLISHVVDATASAQDKALALWSLFAKKTYHSLTPHPGPEAHDPIKVIHVYGYGQCDDVATAFFTVCQKAGLRARIISQQNHVVTEIEYDNKWHLFDASTGTIFRDNAGNIVGIAEIYKDISRCAENCIENKTLLSGNLLRISQHKLP